MPKKPSYGLVQLPSPSLDDYKDLLPLCSGAAKRTPDGRLAGRQCKYYWPLVYAPEKFRADDKTIQRQRICDYLRPDTDDLGDAGARMPVLCGRYERSTRPYDAKFESSVANTKPSGARPAIPDADQLAAAQVAGLVAAAKARRAAGTASPIIYSPDEGEHETTHNTEGTNGQK